MKKMNNKGFSLVELIIVIAIMAILIGVLAPQYLKYVEKSKVSSDKDTLDAIYNACVTAAADPDLSANVPTTNFDFGSSFPNNSWGSEVLSTLGLTNVNGISAKLKSKTCNNSAVNVNVDAAGNFTVTCGSLKVPEN